ncbi:MAG: hypothetical protein HYY82_01505 [Deltaproteobacteria bacterium]|nr:hypothetical protein [Deltaproteobacteria bacterium]
MAKQSLLTDFHRSNGAVFTERDGWLLPVHFGDTDGEYESVRRAAGLFELSHRGLLQFTGPDRVSFLQGMLSNDLRPLKARALRAELALSGLLGESKRPDH